MKLLIVFQLLLAGLLQASQAGLLPGITYYDGPEKLTGKLIFLLQHNKPKDSFAGLSNSLTAASIYEFDLQQKKVRKVIDSPNGILIPSRDGSTVCVVYQLGIGQESNTNIFILSKSLGLIRILHLSSPPGRVVAIAGHVFFEVGEMFRHRLADYDIAKDSIRQIAFPNASKWEIQDYDQIHSPLGQTNVLHFQYSSVGKRIVEGTDFTNGIYSLDINTGTIQPFMIQRLGVDRDDDNYWFKSFDGNFIGFTDGVQAPISGFILASTPWNYIRSDEVLKDDKENNIKILHKFSKLEARFKSTSEYYLIQTSPDLHYAWVKTGEGGTYYLVDVDTGKTRILFKTDDSVPMVRWVQ